MFLILWILVLGAVGTVSASENFNKEPIPSDWRTDVLKPEEKIKIRELYSKYWSLLAPNEKFIITLEDEDLISRLSDVCRQSDNPLCNKIIKEIDNSLFMNAILTCKQIFKNNPSDVARCERLKY